MLDQVAESHWLSPTQIDMYRLCPRKWGWRYRDGVKFPPNKYAERGLACHDIQANWLQKGVAPDQSTDYGKICAPGIVYLPEPGTGLVEHRFRFKTEVASYVGVWDLFVPITQDIYPIHPPQIYDHKFTSDLKWMKNAADLSKDVQANLYAVGAIVTTKDTADKLCVELGAVLNWVYYRTQAKRPHATPVQLHVIPDEHDAPKVNHFFLPGNFGVLRFSALKENFDAIERTAEKMLDHHRQEHKALDISFNVEGCNAFGGCPYKGNPCDLSIGQIVGGHMAQDAKTKSLIAKMGGAQQASTAGEDKEPAAAATGAGSKDLISRMGGAGAGASEEAAAPATSEAPATVNSKMGAAAETGPKVNPPEENTKQPAAEKELSSEAAADSQSVSKAIRKQADEHGEEYVSLRLMLAGEVSGGLVSARLWNHNEPRYAAQVGSFSLEIADEILKRSTK